MSGTKFKIQSRYEYWGSWKDNNKIIWTKWFNCFGETYNTLEEAESRLKEIKDSIKNIDKITKLKHEFQIIKME